MNSRKNWAGYWSIMKIIFSDEYDANVYPSLHDQKSAAFGETIAGPLKLLSLIETALGLPDITQSRAKRVQVWLEKLFASCSEDSFFNKSLKQDGPGTASFLLKKRDELVLAGWNPNEHTRFRFADLAKAENSEPVMPLGFPERILAIINMLPSNQLSEWQIEAHCDINAMGNPWPILFDLLEKSDVNVIQSPDELIIKNPKTDLGKIQQLLSELNQNKTTQPDPVLLQSDGSLIIVNSDSEAVSSAYLSRWIEMQKVKNDTVLIVPEQDSLLIDAINARGLPAAGHVRRSNPNPVSGILTLSLELLWLPVDPRRILDFLSLPVSPINRSIAMKLARVFANKPGIGNQEWKDTLDKQARVYQEKYPDKSIEDFILPVKVFIDRKRYDSLEGIPATELRTILNELERWAKRRAHAMGLEDNPIANDLIALSEKAKQLLYFFRNDGNNITRLELDRYYKQVGNPDGLMHKESELGAWPVIAKPGALRDSARHLIWWNFIAADRPSINKYWSKNELEYLEQNDIGLRTHRELLNRYQQSQVSALLKTTDSVTLFWPATVNGEKTAAHPLISSLEAHSKNFSDICIGLDDWASLVNKKNNKSDLSITQSIKQKNLPNLESPWKITKPIATRNPESYSSIQKLFYAPNIWFLEYVLKLKHVSIYSPLEDSRLDGNIAHALLQDILMTAGFKNPDDPKISKWVEDKLQELCEQEGLQYYLPGKELQKRSLLNATTRAAHEIIRGLHQSGWDAHGVEIKVDGKIDGIPLMGYIDLALTKQDQRCVVDLKLSGKKYKTTEFEENRALQLAIYSILFGQPKPADIAYFIIDTATWITQQDKVIKKSIVVPSKNGGIDDFRKRIQATWKYRKQQLEQGIIETPNPEEAMPDGCLEYGERIFPAEDYGVFLGFEEVL